VFDAAKALVIGKQKDYGTRNIAATPFGSDKTEVVRAVLTRLNDKVARLANLAVSGQLYGTWNEPAMDTAYDIMGYGAILALVLDDAWPGVDD